MGIDETLPDRPLQHEEFRDVQAQDTFDSVTTVEGHRCSNPDCDHDDVPAHLYDVLIFNKDGTDHVLVYTDEQGWHKNTDCQRDQPCKIPANPDEIEAAGD